MHFNVNLSVYVRTCVCVRVCACVRVRTCVGVRACVRVRACVYVRACVRACVRVCGMHSSCFLCTTCSQRNLEHIQRVAGAPEHTAEREMTKKVKPSNQQWAYPASREEIVSRALERAERKVCKHSLCKFLRRYSYNMYSYVRIYTHLP